VQNALDLEEQETNELFWRAALRLASSPTCGLETSFSRLRERLGVFCFHFNRINAAGSGLG